VRRRTRHLHLTLLLGFLHTSRSGRLPGPPAHHRQAQAPLVSVPVSVNQPAQDRTLAIRPDLAPDLTCTDSTRADAWTLSTSLRIWRSGDTACMDRRLSSTGPPPFGRVTLSLYGPIGELAAALRTLAEILDREQTSGAVTYAAAVEADAPGPVPGGMTAALADRFVAQLTAHAVEVLAVLCRNAPELTYAALQAQVDIGRNQLGGVLTSLAAARKRLPLEAAALGSGLPDRARLGGTTLPDRTCRSRVAPGRRQPRPHRHATHGR
jgi:hypothetical protein